MVKQPGFATPRSVRGKFRRRAIRCRSWSRRRISSGSGRSLSGPRAACPTLDVALKFRMFVPQSLRGLSLAATGAMAAGRAGCTFAVSSCATRCRARTRSGTSARHQQAGHTKALGQMPRARQGMIPTSPRGVHTRFAASQAGFPHPALELAEGLPDQAQVGAAGTAGGRQRSGSTRVPP